MDEPHLTSKARQLWQAATDGDLLLVRKIASDPTVDINWKDEEYHRTPFFRACGHGCTVVAEFFLGDPRTDLNGVQKEGATAFSIACQEGHREVVEMLLADQRIDVNLGDRGGRTPFFMASKNGRAEIATLLLASCRVDPNRLTSNCTSPLWIIAQNGHLPVAQLLLASDVPIDTHVKSIFNNNTASEHGRRQVRIPREETEGEEEARLRHNFSHLVSDLIDDYEVDPAAVKLKLRRLQGIKEPYIGRMFAVVVFYSDNFLEQGGETSAALARFLGICARMPLELQMVICNRAYGSARNIVPSRDSEPGFRWLTNPTMWR